MMTERTKTPKTGRASGKGKAPAPQPPSRSGFPIGPVESALHIQRTAGNHAMIQMMRKGMLQAQAGLPAPEEEQLPEEGSIQEKYKGVMQEYSETKNLGAKNELAAARRVDYPQLGVSEHNYAVEEGIPGTRAASNRSNHSEPQAAANALGYQLDDYSLVLLSERQPCQECEDALRNIEAVTSNDVDVDVKYLVDYTDDNDAMVEELREVYSDVDEESSESGSGSESEGSENDMKDDK